MARRVSRLAIALFAACALWQAGSAGYIALKAELAQYLLARAWQRTLAGDEAVKPWRGADTWPVARLVLPGAELVVLEGASGRNLAFGPAHVTATARPGAPGTSVIAGHRDTHFAALEGLAPGDRVTLETADATLPFEVTATAVVHERDTVVLDGDAPASRLVLVTCYPFRGVAPGTPWRYVVEAQPAAAGS